MSYLGDCLQRLADFRVGFGLRVSGLDPKQFARRSEIQYQLNVNWAKQILTLLVLANWFACIVHCQSEQARLTRNPTDSVQTSFVAASQASGGEDCHVCDWVATGGYKTSESRVVAPDVVVVLVPAFMPSPHYELPLAQVHFAEWSTPPPDLPGTFLFVCRTALPVRAPSLAS